MPPTNGPDPHVHTPESVRLKEYLERIIDERDRLYDTRFKGNEVAIAAALAAQKDATTTALASQEKATAAAFAASEKAIDKAETAQREYNIRSNEFRAALDDSNKSNIPRTEADERFKAITAKLEQTKATIDEKIVILNNDVYGLRESRASNQGKEGQSDKSTIGERWAISAGLVVVGIVLSATVIVLRLLGL